MNRPSLLRGLSATAGVGALSPFLRPAKSAAQTRRTLTLGLTSRSANEWTIFVADKAGFFAANGLQVDQIVVGSSAACAQQLTAGSIDIGSVSSTQVVEAVLGGAPIVEILNEMTIAPYSILARKGTTAFAQLKGKTMIVGGPNDITRIFADKVIAGNGLRPDDVTYTFAGATSDRYAALLSGSVDAAILLPPFSFRAAGDGYPVVAEVQKYVQHFPFGGLAARIDWAKSHSDYVVAFDKSCLQAVQWLSDPSKKNRAVDILVEGTNTRREDALGSYDLLVSRLHVYSRDGRFSDDDFRQVLEALVGSKQVSLPTPLPSRFYDNRYADQAFKGIRAPR